MVSAGRPCGGPYPSGLLRCGPIVGVIGSSDAPFIPNERPKPGNRYRRAIPTFGYGRYVWTVLDWYRSWTPSTCAYLVQAAPSRAKPYEATRQGLDRQLVLCGLVGGCCRTMRVPALGDRGEREGQTYCVGTGQNRLTKRRPMVLMDVGVADHPAIHMKPSHALTDGRQRPPRVNHGPWKLGSELDVRRQSRDRPAL